MELGRSLIAVFGAALLTAAAPYSVALDIRQCTGLPPAVARALGPNWIPLAAFAERCSVPGPAGRKAVTVDIVRLDRPAAVQILTADPEKRIPLPIVRDASGQAVGTLPQQFPVEGPGRLKVRFSHWDSGVPQKIMLFEAGESALPPHSLPSQHRDARTGRYH
ncbi:hypothetical protein KZX46_02165 (plasmid) [Polymorphobacter sp. PAMC 29334]|uniref:hypothetical protein n=1 Tax=Polymorphobacter sp. PAMC 29334 TaxID=2862331 RepID=UPI001C797A59|nr:hypothetical protein [Polymorphobacter sp. PAMC 29334]QYE32978.1 hypothetical protein KZX46_02165 [Polymorphobacter sp. PAMC 29334]